MREQISVLAYLSQTQSKAKTPTPRKSKTMKHHLTSHLQGAEGDNDWIFIFGWTLKQYKLAREMQHKQKNQQAVANKQCMRAEWDSVTASYCKVCVRYKRHQGIIRLPAMSARLTRGSLYAEACFTEYWALVNWILLFLTYNRPFLSPVITSFQSVNFTDN